MSCLRWNNACVINLSWKFANKYYKFYIWNFKISIVITWYLKKFRAQPSQMIGPPCLKNAIYFYERPFFIVKSKLRYLENIFITSRCCHSMLTTERFMFLIAFRPMLGCDSFYEICWSDHSRSASVLDDIPSGWDMTQAQI